MNFRLILSTTVFSLLVGTSLQASIQTTPTGLAPGAEYRLAFVTSGTLLAISANIDEYNLFVDTAANAVAGLAALNADWKAIVSTASTKTMAPIDARDNTGTNPSADGTGVPIYLLNDTKLADSNSGLWDGSIDVPLNITEFGAVLTGGLVWTGTDTDGVGLSGWELGGSFSKTSVGNVAQLNSRWVTQNAGKLVRAGSTLPFYALSSVLTVAAVPEPSSFLVWGLLLCIGAIRVSTVKARRRNCA